MRPAKLGHDPWASLRISNFRRYLIARFSIILASQIQYVVVAQILYEWTHDPLVLGLSGLCEAIPAIVCALPAGHLIDRGSAKKFLLTSYLGAMLATLLILWAVTYQNGVALFLYLPMGLIGIIRAFLSPANFSVQTSIVPVELYFNCSTWDSGLWHIAAVSGPALGGILYSTIGAEKTFILVLGLICLACLTMALVMPPPKVKSAAPENASLWRNLIEGFNFVKARQLMIGAMSLDMFAVLFGGAVALLPIFASEILHAGAQGLGYLRAAPALGATVMGLSLAFLPPIKKAGRALLLTVLGFGFATIGFALSTNFWIAFAFLVLTGMFDNISIIVRGTIVKTMTPVHMRARISAVNSIFIGSSNEIGAFESGFTAKLMGTIPAVIFGGCMTVLVVLIASIKAKKLRQLDFSKADWANT
ncbi:MAG: MFS transporter [Bdellovibrio sp.]|nr:MFS transporter [Bdellovibrio sp.]